MDVGKGNILVCCVVFMLLVALSLVRSDTTIGNPAVTKFREVKGSGDPSYTGMVPINIPLYTVPGRSGLNFPITLSYSPGIKTHQEAGPVGLGFAIQIGSMQRGVNGFVDELTLQSDSTRLNVAKIGACVNKN
ncbi:MAG: hypothetical protein ABIJ21_07100, partial [Nanoarchaeota archaeon]